VLAKLDLPIRMGEETGVVLKATIGERDSENHLARSDFAGGSLWARDMGFEVGSKIRLRVLARDVSLALEAPQSSSILNILPATVDGIGDCEHPGLKLVRVMVGESAITCRMSKRSIRSLQLEPGKSVWVQIKSAAVIE
jgi:molybdate transport system ATP-binding protein